LQCAGTARAARRKFYKFPRSIADGELEHPSRGARPATARDRRAAPRFAAATEEGFPLLRHVRDLVEGPCVWAPILRGGLLVSRRGGDFAMVCGRDAAIGYDSHDGRSIRLYLTESFGVRIPGPEACVPLPRDA
jgi:Encapsulating protein for peroxidase